MRKLITIVLIQFCSLLSFAQFTDTQCDEQGIEYTANDDGTTCTVTGYIDNCNAEIIIPGFYEGLAVTSIGENAFEECERLTSIVIPNSVSSIGEAAFYGCTALSSFIIPSSVTNIGFGAFEGCINLSSIVVDEDNPFYDSRDNCNAIIETASNTLIVGCSATIIPNTVTVIGKAAFMGCVSLTTVSIANSVTSIGDEAFSNCSGLTSVTIGNSVEIIGNWSFYNCRSLTSITIPKSVTSIDSNSFEGCSGLTSIVVEEGNPFFDSRDNCNAIIKTWYNNSILIMGCKTTTIPNTVSTIGYRAFYGCSDLTSITIPNSVTYIESHAFWDCSGLTSITIPNSVVRIEDAFNRCSGLTSLSIPKSVTNISLAAFSRCSGLTSIVVEEGNPCYDSRNNCNAIIETASNSLITGCQTTIIPNTVTSIGPYAFTGRNGLTSIIIPNSVEIIGSVAFEECSDLTSITIPSSVTSIGNSAFRDCDDLASATIPSSVTSIGDNVFWGCSSLASLTVGWDTPLAINKDAFRHVNLSNLTLYVPEGTLAAYEEADVWKDFGTKKEMSAPFTGTVSDSQGVKYTANDDETTCYVSGHESSYSATITIPEVYEGRSVTSIGESAFEDCSSLTSITIPESVASIGGSAFRDCSGLTSITIHEGVTSIGDGAFYRCSALTSITIPSSVTSIGLEAFCVCRGLTSITIPEGVTSIGEAAFSGCSGLTTIIVEKGNNVFDSRDNCNAIIKTSDNTLVVGCKNTIIPSSVTSIWGAFSGCSGLTSITIPSCVTSIGSCAFWSCSGLTSITIPSSVTSIGERAFCWCGDLTLITIPESVTSMGFAAFYGCDALTSVTVGWNTPLEIDKYVFNNINLSNLTLYVPKGTKSAYQAAAVWRDFGTIVEMVSGDLSGDGTVNGTDLVVQTNLILNGEYNPVADLNNDAKVNGTDYVMMVNVILDIASARAMTATTANRDAELSIEDFSIRAGETKEMLVSLRNPDTDLTLLQFDLRLPAGLSIAKEGDDEGVDIAGRTTWKKHSLRSNAVGDVTRILLASNANAVFSGDEGRVVSIRLTADDGFSGGDIYLENQLLVAPDAWETAPARYVYTVGITTSIGGLKAGQSADVYTLTGSKVRCQATSLDGLPKGVYVVKGRKVVVR